MNCLDLTLKREVGSILVPIMYDQQAICWIFKCSPIGPIVSLLLSLHMEQFQAQGFTEQSHQCTSHREGDWIVWRCPHCNGYERRFNWVTNEMKVRNGGSSALHTGMSTKSENMEALRQVIALN